MTDIWNPREQGSRRKSLLLASTLLCAPFLALPSAALAQEAPSTTLAQEATPKDRTGEEEIVVTGSRLARPDLSAPSPVTIVGEAEIKNSGNVTIEQTLNEFPQLASGNSSTVNNGGGSGILTANLRGLGATRTLVLVNGRRFIPADSNGLVDLSTIPDALVERVEIITGGASAVYGSDAVAGAVNFILKKNFTGLEASYQYGQSFENDGASHKVDVTYGANIGDRGNVVFSASYTKRDPVFQGDRKFSSVPLDTVNGALVPGGSGNVPGTRIGLSNTQISRLVGVAGATGACTAQTGIVFGANGAPQAYCTPESAYNYASFNYLLRPLERIQGSMIGHYELTDNIEAFSEVYFINNRNASRLAPDSFVPITPGAASQTLLVPNYATNPILPVATRNFFVANRSIFDPTNSGTATVVGAGRRADELGTRDSNFERNSMDLTGGFRGNFDALGSNWRWEAFYQYQRNHSETRGEGVISQTRLALGLDAVTNAAGQVVCRNAILGCVPVNIFGLNTITPAAGVYLTPVRVSTDEFQREVGGASISGSLFDLPAGAVEVALGTEYRRDSYHFDPSPLDLANEYGTTSQKPTAGAYNLKEVFGEIRIPILTEKPFFHSLSIEGAARYSDYSTVGNIFTWKAGLEYAPIDWVRIRSAYNRAVRAPSIGELYAPVTDGFTSGTDPCAASLNPSAAQKALCVAQGISAADINTFTSSALGFTARSGGNPNLHEEKSKTITVGAVISPPFLRRLNLTVDYFKVKVSDGIAAINANQTISDCFANLDINSTTCRNITRLPNGQVDIVSIQTSNLAALKVEGLDVQLDYKLPLGGFFQLDGEDASLTFSGVASWLFERSTQVLSNQAPIDCAGKFGNGCIGTGTFGTPDFKLNLSATYNSGPVTFRTAARMIDKMTLYTGVVSPVHSAPAQWYFDMTGTVRLKKGLELFGGIDNLFDKQPPILGTALSGDANTDVSLYDVIGRRFFVGGRVRF